MSDHVARRPARGGGEDLYGQCLFKNVFFHLDAFPYRDIFSIKLKLLSLRLTEIEFYQFSSGLLAKEKNAFYQLFLVIFENMARR